MENKPDFWLIALFVVFAVNLLCAIINLTFFIREILL